MLIHTFMLKFVVKKIFFLFRKLQIYPQKAIFLLHGVKIKYRFYYAKTESRNILKHPLVCRVNEIPNKKNITEV